MPLLRLACAAALAVPFLASSRPAPQSPTFHPREGLALDKRFDVALDLKLDRGDIRVHGGSTDFKTSLPTGIEVGTATSLAVVDTYGKVRDGRPLSLVRRFDELELAWHAGDSEAESDAFEQHDDLAVRFQWNEKKKRYDSFFEDVDGEKEVLAWFREDADLRGLLPSGAVEVGESWNATPTALAETLLPALSLDVLKTIDEHVHDDEVMAALSSVLRDLGADVKTECTWRGIVDVDGRKLGKIDVVVRGKPKVDLAEAFGKALDEEELRAKTARLQVDLDGRGELLWDMEAGHFASFDMKSDIDVAFDAELSIAEGDGSWTTTVNFAASGEGAWSYSAKAR